MLTKATVGNVTRLFREAKYPSYFINLDEPEIELEVLSYGYIRVVQLPDDEDVSVVVQDVDHPIRYLVSEIELESGEFISDGKNMLFTHIDKNDLM